LQEHAAIHVTSSLGYLELQQRLPCVQQRLQALLLCFAAVNQLGCQRISSNKQKFGVKWLQQLKTEATKLQV
jgi:hypothetical protein